MASTWMKRGVRYIAFKDSTGKRRQEPTKAKTRTEALRLGREMEMQAERIRRGLETGPMKSDLTVAKLLDWWARAYLAKAPSRASTEKTTGSTSPEAISAPCSSTKSRRRPSRCSCRREPRRSRRRRSTCCAAICTRRSRARDAPANGTARTRSRTFRSARSRAAPVTTCDATKCRACSTRSRRGGVRSTRPRSSRACARASSPHFGRATSTSRTAASSSDAVGSVTRRRAEPLRRCRSRRSWSRSSKLRSRSPPRRSSSPPRTATCSIRARSIRS